MLIPPPAPRPRRPLPLELVRVSKHFGSFVANHEVSLSVPPGTVHALVGENGAGKSTLVKCLMGFHGTDGGDIVIDGKSREIRSPYDAFLHGIGMVYQHFTLVPSMTVAENLLLSRPDLPAVIPWRQERRRLEEFMSTAPFRVDLDLPASQLAAGQKQKVEILKQLYLESRFLILDEPTSVLTPAEADEVFALIRSKVDAGDLSVLLITHKFREVFGVCDDVTVLRRGRVAGGGRVSDFNADTLGQLMMGGQREARTTARSSNPPGDVALEICQLSASRDNGLPALEGIDLRVRAGEIVGIAGISGNGQRELVEVLAGQRPATAGGIQVQGEYYHATREEAARHQVHILPEEPLRNACVPAMSVAENIAFRSFDRPPIRRTGSFVSRRAIRELASGLIERFGVRTRSTETPIGDLSGGNVQRAILARELGSGSARVLVAANPCFGLDFAAVEAVHARLTEARNGGTAVLLVSEDLDELLALSDRILVISQGRFVHGTTPAAADITAIGRHMAGH